MDEIGLYSCLISLVYIQLLSVLDKLDFRPMAVLEQIWHFIEFN